MVTNSLKIKQKTNHSLSDTQRLLFDKQHELLEQPLRLHDTVSLFQRCFQGAVSNLLIVLLLHLKAYETWCLLPEN